MGVKEKWYSSMLTDQIRLPGSMMEQGKGDRVTINTQWTGSIYDSSWYFHPRLEKYRHPEPKFPFWLTPTMYYVGAAWYQRIVTIPDSWNQRIVLHLERPHTETRVWIDDREIGMQNSMVVAHEYDLTGKISPGTHTITIRVDNRIKEINVGPDSHSLTDHTQGNWNGIIGKIELRSEPLIWMEDIQVYPNLGSKAAVVKVLIRNNLKKEGFGEIMLSANAFNTTKQHAVAPVKKPFTADPGEEPVEILYAIGDSMLTWSEFDPALYKLTVTLTSNSGVHKKEVQFGMREFKTSGTRFEVNGRPVFLRGNVDCAAFPLTGYPPTDIASWEQVIKTCKDHGLNHIRFHSWCPPEAAFLAADKLGFYLQPEAPSWPNHGSSLGDGKPIDQFIYEETDRMAKVYGNYASFCMLAAGNEPAGSNQAKYLGEFVNYWKAKDKRRVYTGASVGMSWPLVPEAEFIVKSGPRNLPWNRSPQTQFDHRSKIEEHSVPYVSHEIGQYCAYPDFKEIKKYTGVYKAKNFEMFKEDLEDHHIGDQAETFLQASGKLQALSYKHEIEAALRTPGFAGFQLLSLNDFPGQGTALVGVLNAFYEPKGYIKAEEFRRFCNATVPLARLPKFVFTNNESFEASVELYHFGETPLRQARVTWRIVDGSGKEVTKSTFAPKDIPVGNCFTVGTVTFPLQRITKASKFTLEVFVENTSFKNDWEFWVYPSSLPEVVSSDVHFCTSLDEKAMMVLNHGGKVFLHAAGKVENGKDVVQHFKPVFWNTSWFKMRPPHTLGIVVDPGHAAFAQFPTEFHSNLQWWEILDRQQVMNLENFPPSFRPIVQPIDTWFINRRLGMVFEAKVGKGKILVCSADLTSKLDERPATRQLLYSFMQYMQSEKFDPIHTIDIATIRELFEVKERETYNPFTKATPDELKPKQVTR